MRAFLFAHLSPVAGDAFDWACRGQCTWRSVSGWPIESAVRDAAYAAGVRCGTAHKMTMDGSEKLMFGYDQAGKTVVYTREA
jgi:hypothetical protein